MDCPKCHKEISDAVVECPHCHIVVAQYLKRRREMASGVVTPGAPAPVEEEKKGRSLWLLILLSAVVAGYFILHSSRHKPGPGPQPAGAVAPAEPNTPETTAAPAPSSDAAETPDTASVDAPPQDSSATVESNDSNASAESFKKGDQKIKKLLHATAPLRIGNPEKVLENK